jgi:DHA1 family inner membrane transport protein
MADPSQRPDTGGTLLIPVLSAANFVIGMGAFVVVGMLTPIARGFGTTPAEAGAILTSYAIAYALLSPLLVAATGAIGRRRVMAFGLGLFAVAAALSALAPGLGALHAARVLAAAGAGLFTPVAAAVVAGLTPPERRARALAAVFFGLTLAQVAGVPAGSALAYAVGWRATFAVVAVLALPCLWLVWTRVPRGLAFRPAGLADLGGVLRDGPVMLAVLCTTSYLGAIFVLNTYLAPLLEARMGFGGAGVSAALFVAGLGAVGGNVLGGMAADRFGPGRTILALALAQAGLMPLFALLPLPVAAAMALVFVWSLAGWSFMSGQQTRLVALDPSRASVVLALNAAAIYVGAAAGSAAGGAVLAQNGPQALGIGGGIAALAAAGHVALSLRVGRRTP